MRPGAPAAKPHEHLDYAEIAIIFTFMRHTLGAALFMALALCACSRQESQHSLARRLGQADRVIVLNSGNGLTKTLKGEELKKIIQAIEAAEKIQAEGLSATPGYTLVFFTAGGIHIATVPTAGVVFWIHKTPYQDKTGTIQTFYANPGLAFLLPVGGCAAVPSLRVWVSPLDWGKPLLV